jgi:hypothetical protein
MSYLAEIMGVIAVIINVISYRQHDMNRYRLVSAVALSFLAFHFFLLDAISGAIVLLISVIRNLMAMRWQTLWLAILFAGITILFGLLEWFFVAELQSVFAALASSVGASEWGYQAQPWTMVFAYVSALIFAVGTILIKDTTQLRKCFVAAEGLGLIYALSVGSILGTVFNVFNLVSILFTLYQDSRNSCQQSQ